MKFNLTQNRNLYKSIMAIALPVAFQNLINFSLNMLDTVMIGQLGENDIAAAGLANQPFFVFILLIFGIASGAVVLTAQYYGKSDIEPVKKVITLALWVSFLFGAVVAFLIFSFPEKVMSFYTNEAPVIVQGTKYLHYASISYFFTAISSTYLGIVVSIGNVYLPLKINCISLTLNTFFNYIFIFGKLGAPAMGIEGAGLATLIARIIEFLIVMAYIFKIDDNICLRPRDFLKFDKILMFDFVKYSFPVVINELLWSGGVSMYATVIGRMGAAIAAAYSIAMITERLCSAFIFGLGKAASVILGEQLGKGNTDTAYNYANSIMDLAGIIGIISGAVMIGSGFILPYFFNITEQSQQALIIILSVIGIMLFFNAINSVNVVSVLRSGGDTAFAMAIDVSFIWLVSLPLCYLTAKHGYPLIVVMLALKAEEFIKFWLGLWRVRTKKWLRNLTR